MPVFVVFFKCGTGKFLERAGFVVKIRRKIFKHFFPLGGVRIRQNRFLHFYEHFKVASASGNVNRGVRNRRARVVCRVVFGRVARQNAIGFAVRERLFAGGVMNPAVRVRVIFGREHLPPVVRGFRKQGEENILFEIQISARFQSLNIRVGQIFFSKRQNRFQLVKVIFPVNRNLNVAVCL